MLAAYLKYIVSFRVMPIRESRAFWFTLDFLRHQGEHRELIRMNYQPIQDHRMQNKGVEITSITPFFIFRFGPQCEHILNGRTVTDRIIAWSPSMKCSWKHWIYFARWICTTNPCVQTKHLACQVRGHRRLDQKVAALLPVYNNTCLALLVSVLAVPNK